MRQLTYIEPERLEWWDVPEPVLETGPDALVRVRELSPGMDQRLSRRPSLRRHRPRHRQFAKRISTRPGLRWPEPRVPRSPGSTRYALRSTQPCGYCTGVSGGLTGTTELPLSSLYLRGVTYEVSRVHGRAMLPVVLEHLCRGAFDPLAIAHRTVPFAEAAEAMADPAAKLIFRR